MIHASAAKRAVAAAGLAFCVFIALLIMYTGFAKASDLPSFGRVLNEHRVLPLTLQSVALWLVPCAEVAIGTLAIT